MRLAAIKARFRGWPLYGTLRAVYRLAADRVYRRGRRLSRKHPANLFQPFASTREDRYPKIFRFVRDRLGDGDRLRLLSFGCATGEEVFTLRRYFAAAAITGIDIDPANIARCRAGLARSGAAGLSFAVGGSTEGEAAESYDAIFCMAVLRHGGLAETLPESCDTFIRFADFDRTVADFARCLKPGGLLILRHSNFRFCDAPASAGFETVLQLPANMRTPLYGRDNRRLAGARYDDVVFRKRGGAARA